MTALSIITNSRYSDNIQSCAMRKGAIMFTQEVMADKFGKDVVLEFTASTTVDAKGGGVPIEQTFRLSFENATLQQVCELAAKEVIIREQAAIRKGSSAEHQRLTPVVYVSVEKHKPSVRAASGGASVSRSISALVKKAKAGKLTSAELAAHSKDERKLLLEALQASLDEAIANG